MTTAVLNLVDHPWPLLGVLFVLLVVVVELGHRLRLATAANTDEQLREPLVGARDSIGLLLSLLLGFTLAMALPRYEDRKKLTSTRPMRSEPRRCARGCFPNRHAAPPCGFCRIMWMRGWNFRRLLNGQELQNSLARTKQLQEAMWQQSVAVAEQNPTPLTAISSNL